MDQIKMKKNKYGSGDRPPLAVPQALPCETVGEYFVSKDHVKLAKIVPNFDLVGRGPGLNSWRAHRENTSARQQLTNAMAQYKRHREEIDKKWDELGESQCKMREAFMKFNKFVCENEDKSKYAVDKKAEDDTLLKMKTLEIEKLQRDILEMENVCTNMEERLEKYSAFKNYLSTVIEDSDFDHPMDIIRHFEALTETKNNLSKIQDDFIVKLEATVSEMLRLIENKKSQLMGMNNSLATLMLRYENTKAETKKWEMILHKLKEETAKRYLEFSRVRESLWILYQKICNEKSIQATCSKDDYEGQLVTVMRGLVEIKNIVKKAEKKSAIDLASDQTQISE